MSTQATSRPRAAVLAEGVSGREKTALSGVRFGGRSLLEHQLELARVLDPCPFVLASANPRVGGPYTWIQVRSPERGLLGEIATVLQAAAGPVVTLAVELPLIRERWLEYLELESARLWPGGARDPSDGTAPAAVLPAAGGGLEPRAGLFHPDAAAVCREALREGRTDPAEALRELPAVVVRREAWRRLGAGDLELFCRGPEDVARAAAAARDGEGYHRRERRSLPEAGRDAGAMRIDDLGEAPVRTREAVAGGRIRMGPQAFALLVDGSLPRGDAVAAARVAALQAVKRTAELVPLCRPQELDAVDVSWRFEPERSALAVEVAVKARTRDGLAMQALHGASVFLLTVFDMARTVDRDLSIDAVRLVSESGDQEGDLHYQEAAGR